MVAGDLGHWLPSWELHLRALNRSPKTLTTYLEAARQLLAFLTDRGMPTHAASIHREPIEAFLVHLQQTRSSSTAANRYRSLRQLFRWMDEDGEIPSSPMARMHPPGVEEKAVPVIPDDDLRALIKACQGQGFETRRDTALTLAFMDTGARLSEVADLQLENLDLYRSATLVVQGKGSRERILKVGPKTPKALDRYLRLRARHAEGESPWLWLGKQGRLTDSGIAQMLRRRCAQAGIDTINPHQFRHTFSHNWLGRWGAGPHDAHRLEEPRDARQIRGIISGRTGQRCASTPLACRAAALTGPSLGLHDAHATSLGRPHKSCACAKVLSGAPSPSATMLGGTDGV